MATAAELTLIVVDWFVGSSDAEMVNCSSQVWNE